MTGRPTSRIVKFLVSARLATVLLSFVTVWSILASFVPQGAPSDAKVSAWASAHPLAETAAGLLGLHRAFGAPLFLLCIAILALSTALCAWRRTQVAIARGRLVRDVRAAGAKLTSAGGDLSIECDSAFSDAEILSVASRTLAGLGVRTRRTERAVVSVSPEWSVWGSPIFHWALLALMLTVVFGNLFRSSGQIGLAVAQSKADAPSSYGILNEGPWHGQIGGERTVRVDAFELTYKTGGVNRGPTPTVTVLDEQGRIIKSQRVYPNHTLKTGSLTIYPADYGLAAGVSMTDGNGTDSGRVVQLIDFSSTAAGGTTSVGSLSVGDPKKPTLKARVTVPLDRVEGGLAARLPKVPVARVVVTSADDEPVIEDSLAPGEALELPGGGSLRLLDLGYYARLQLVDDPSIPVLYAGLVVAMIGLGIATLARQQIIVATVVRTDVATQLEVRMRLWRSMASSRSEMETELTKALSGHEEREDA